MKTASILISLAATIGSNNNNNIVVSAQKNNSADDGVSGGIRATTTPRAAKIVTSKTNNNNNNASPPGRPAGLSTSSSTSSSSSKTTQEKQDIQAAFLSHQNIGILSHESSQRAARSRRHLAAEEMHKTVHKIMKNDRRDESTKKEYSATTPRAAESSTATAENGDSNEKTPTRRKLVSTDEKKRTSSRNLLLEDEVSGKQDMKKKKTRDDVKTQEEDHRELLKKAKSDKGWGAGGSSWGGGGGGDGWHTSPDHGSGGFFDDDDDDGWWGGGGKLPSSHDSWTHDSWDTPSWGDGGGRFEWGSGKSGKSGGGGDWDGQFDWGSGKSGKSGGGGDWGDSSWGWGSGKSGKSGGGGDWGGWGSGKAGKSGGSGGGWRNGGGSGKSGKGWGSTGGGWNGGGGGGWCGDWAWVTVTNLSVHQSFSEIFVMTGLWEVTDKKPIYRFGEYANEGLHTLAEEADASDMEKRYKGRHGVEQVKVFSDFDFGSLHKPRFLKGGTHATFKVRTSGFGKYLSIAVGLPFTNDGAVVLEGGAVYDGAEYYIPAIDAGTEANIQTCWSVEAEKDEFPPRSQCARENDSDNNFNNFEGEGFVSMHRGMQELSQNELNNLLFVECNDIDDIDYWGTNYRFVYYFYEVGFRDPVILCENPTSELDYDCDPLNDSDFLHRLDNLPVFWDESLLIVAARQSNDFEEFCQKVRNLNNEIKNNYQPIEPYLFDWRNEIMKVEIDCGWHDDGWDGSNGWGNDDDWSVDWTSSSYDHH